MSRWVSFGGEARGERRLSLVQRRSVRVMAGPWRITNTFQKDYMGLSHQPTNSSIEIG